MTDLITALGDLARLFDQFGAPYAVMGGLAVRVHGIPRPTYDVDFTLAIDRARLLELYDAVRALGYTVPEEYQGGWVDQVAGMPLVKARLRVEGKTIDVDVFLAESRFQKSLIQRRIQTDVEGITAWIASAEDLILLKLLAGRPRDIGDIQDILLVQGPLDQAYLQHWADELGVRPQLTRALEDFTR